MFYNEVYTEYFTVSSKGNALTEEQREIQRLKREVAQLKLERDILKKASALLAIDTLGFHR